MITVSQIENKREIGDSTAHKQHLLSDKRDAAKKKFKSGRKISKSTAVFSNLAKRQVALGLGQRTIILCSRYQKRKSNFFEYAL